MKTNKSGFFPQRASSFRLLGGQSGLLTTMIAALALFATARPSMATPIDISTGINPNWDYSNLTYGPGTGVASIVTPSDADWYGGWLANDAESSWIAAYPNSSGGNNGTYSLTFDLTSADLSTASLSGSWTIDDQGALYLNGNQLSTLGDGTWGALTSFSAPSSDFVLGLNTLSVVGGATDDYLEGVRVEGTLTGTEAAVPDAGLSLGLLSLGLGGLAAVNRRLKIKR